MIESVLVGVVIGCALSIAYMEIRIRKVRGSYSHTVPLPHAARKDKRSARIYPYPELTIEQIEGMFTYGEPMDYSTPHGILHIVPNEGHVMPVDTRRRKHGKD